MLKKLAFKLFEAIGVKEQLRKDLSYLAAAVVKFMDQAEDDPGVTKGAEKRAKALDDFFNSVEEEGGIELPGYLTGDVARYIVGQLVDYLISLTKGEEPGN